MLHLSVHRWPSRRCLYLMAVVACVACSYGEEKTLGPLGIDDGAQGGQKTALLVSPEREATLELKTGARVRVPAGAVDNPVEIGLERPTDEEAMELTKSLTSNEKVGSAPYIVTPHGSAFNEEVEVTLPMSPESEKGKVVVAYLEDENDTDWKYLTSPSFIGNSATFTVRHFSVLIVVEREGPRGGPAPSDSDAGRDSSGDMDAGTTARDAGSTQTLPDASPPSACDTKCDAGHCTYDGLGADCVPGDPAHRCDEGTVKCAEDR